MDRDPTPDAAARHTEFKHYAFFKGYITTAREDGSIPLNSKAVCQLTVMSANGGDAGPTIAMIEQANLAPSFASRIAVLEGAARKVLSRLEYYASLGKDHADGSDVAPNIEDWAYTMGSSDIAELRTALASPARAEGETC